MFCSASQQIDSLFLMLLNQTKYNCFYRICLSDLSQYITISYLRKIYNKKKVENIEILIVMDNTRIYMFVLDVVVKLLSMFAYTN